MSEKIKLDGELECPRCGSMNISKEPPFVGCKDCGQVLGFCDTEETLAQGKELSCKAEAV